MFTYNNSEVLSTNILSKMLNKYMNDVLPKLEHSYKYYNGKQKILTKHYDDPTKPCNKIVTNFCKNIVTSYLGYMAAPRHITYQSDDDIEEILNVLKYNDYNNADEQFLKDALICGVSNELMYVDADKKVRFANISPLNSFGVFSDDLTGDLNFFVRWYKEDEWSDNETYFVEVYDAKNVTKYRMLGFNGTLTQIDKVPHYFSQCPANVFYLEDEVGVFNCIEDLQDSYNTSLSNQVDDISAFTNAYMVMSGSFDPESLDISGMRKNRLIAMPEGTTVSWLTKDIQDTQVKENLDRIQASIYRIAQCPDFSSESFVGGVSSGIAIQYRLTGMETKAASIESSMKKALQRRIELICGYIGMLTGEEVWRDINIIFTRNIPADENAIATMISQLRRLVSDETLLTKLDFVTNPEEEIERVAKQKEEQMSLYDFGLTNEGADEE